MKNITSMNIETAIKQCRLARKLNNISNVTQQKILSQLAVTHNDSSAFQSPNRQKWLAFIQLRNAVGNVKKTYNQIAKEIAPIIEEKKKAERCMFEDRTAEQLAAEYTFKGSKKIATKDKPVIKFDADWWKEQEIIEREEKKAIRRKLKAGEYVDEILLVKYGLNEKDENELVEA